MKFKYKACLAVLIAELVIVKILDAANIQFKSVLANAIGVMAFLSPLVTLFILMSKDSAFPKGLRIAFQIEYWVLIFCYIAGLLAKITF